MKLRSLLPWMLVPLSIAACKTNDAKTDAGAAAAAQGDAAVTTTQASVSDAGAAPATSATPRENAAVYHAFQGRVGKSAFWLGLEQRGNVLRALYVTSSTAQMTGKMTDASHFTLREAKVPKGEKPTTIAGEITPQGTLLATLTDPKTQKKTQLASSGNALDDANKNFKQEYTGSLGGRFIRVKLEKSGANLTGMYRYSKSADDIKLDGTAKDGDASFELTESVKGKTTGKFAGVFVSKGNALATWSSPDGARTFPVKLELGSGYPETVDLGAGLTLFPQESVIEGKRCKADIVFPQLRGAKDAAKQTALNSLLAGDLGKQKTCEGPGPDDPDLMDYEETAGYTMMTKKKGRFVSISQGGWAYTGGVHGNGSSTCAVIDTQSFTRFRMVDSLTDAGRKKLGEMTTKALQKSLGVAKLTDSYFYNDDVEIGKDTNVCLSDTEVSVEFTPYEVAPYMAGPQEATFAKADVKDLFEKNDLMNAVFAP